LARLWMTGSRQGWESFGVPLEMLKEDQSPPKPSQHALRTWSTICGLDPKSQEVPNSWEEFAKFVETRAVTAQRDAKQALGGQGRLPSKNRLTPLSRPPSRSAGIRPEDGTIAEPMHTLTNVSSEPTLPNLSWTVPANTRQESSWTAEGGTDSLPTDLFERRSPLKVSRPKRQTLGLPERKSLSLNGSRAASKDTLQRPSSQAGSRKGSKEWQPRRPSSLVTGSRLGVSKEKLQIMTSAGSRMDSKDKARWPPETILIKEWPSLESQSRKGSEERVLFDDGDYRETLLLSSRSDSALREQQENAPASKPAVARRGSVVTQGLHKVAHELHIPFDQVKLASEIFKKHADSAEGVDLFELKLGLSQFSNVLCDLCNVSHVSDLPKQFVSAAFNRADVDKGGDIDIMEFFTWYAAFSFSEEMTLSKEAQQTRILARKLGLEVIDIERYKRAFDQFDVDKSGSIDPKEFEALLHMLLRLNKGDELPRDRAVNLWRKADMDGSGAIDFEEFCVFYMNYFDDSHLDESDPTRDYYRNVRWVPTV